MKREVQKGRLARRGRTDGQDDWDGAGGMGGMTVHRLASVSGVSGTDGCLVMPGLTGGQDGRIESRRYTTQAFQTGQAGQAGLLAQGCTGLQVQALAALMNANAA